jgi:hypothetical protein
MRRLIVDNELSIIRRRCDEALNRPTSGRGDHLEVQVVNWPFVTTTRLRPLLANPRLCIVVIEQVELIVPRRQNKLVLNDRLLHICLIIIAVLVVVCLADTPIHSRRYQLVFLLHYALLILLFLE